jgi:hypothetical protein
MEGRKDGDWMGIEGLGKLVSVLCGEHRSWDRVFGSSTICLNFRAVELEDRDVFYAKEIEEFSPGQAGVLRRTVR